MIWIALTIVAAAFGADEPDIANFDKAFTPILHQDSIEAPTPWTHLDFKNDPDNFQFAVTSDLYGGYREGIFPKAVDRLNWLQPEFVLTIGDLIQGGTMDELALNLEWDGFESMVHKLEMPFFLIPGNHDNMNDVQIKVWNERFGPTYYGFVYRNVLFLCLDTQDSDVGARYPTGMRRKQIDFMKDALDRHKDVRWTFVMMHQPLWVYEKKDAANPPAERNDYGFAKLQEALQGRPHTVIAGHFHSYIHFEREDANYYVLSTTGGGNRLRGPRLGEFDHLTWITMTPNGPSVANLTLDGILPHDVVGEAENDRNRALLQALRRIELDPPGDSISSDVELAFQNPYPTDLNMLIEWRSDSNWTIEPRSSVFEIGTDSGFVASWSVKRDPPTKGRYGFGPLPKGVVNVALDGEPFLKNHPIAVSISDAYLQRLKPSVSCRKLDSPPTIDGELDDGAWQRTPDIHGFGVYRLTSTPRRPTLGWLGYDEQMIYASFRCAQPNLDNLTLNVTVRDGPSWRDDSITLLVDSNLDRQTYYQFVVNANNVVFDSKHTDWAWTGEMESATGSTTGAWTAEVAIPWKTIGHDGPPKEPAELGINVLRHLPRDKQWLQWSPTLDHTHTASLYARVTLEP
jgi:hypothetical protein